MIFVEHKFPLSHKNSETQVRHLAQPPVGESNCFFIFHVMLGSPSPSSLPYTLWLEQNDSKQVCPSP